jgi:hypothetical protein
MYLIHKNTVYSHQKYTFLVKREYGSMLKGGEMLFEQLRVE